MRVLCIINLKGGVGKTISAVNLAFIFVELFKKLRYPVKAEFVYFDGYEYIVCGNESVQRCHIDIRRTVYDTEIILRRNFLERVFEACLLWPCAVNQNLFVRVY